MVLKKQNVLLDQSGKVGIIRLNRPEVLNCLDPETLDQLRAHLMSCLSEKRIRVVMICGNGRAFSTGNDLKYSKDKDAETLKKLNKKGLVETFTYLQHFRKPTIAVIDGYALGGGFELALSCDFRFASKEKAIFGFPEINLGILPTWGGMYLPLDIVGYSRAMELVMTGKNFDAEKAFTLGLVNRVVPHEQLFEKAMEFAKDLARKGHFLLNLAKHVMRISVKGSHSDRIKWTTIAAELMIAANREEKLRSLLNQE
ncbi:MAG: enoyl-CoA hydratase/isomerase family protein [Candidatus Helarchaeota archaeon]